MAPCTAIPSSAVWTYLADRLSGYLTPAIVMSSLTYLHAILFPFTTMMTDDAVISTLSLLSRML